MLFGTKMLPSFSIIVAADKNRGIGRANALPWPMLKEDMQYFKKMTSETRTPGKINAVIMGSKTYLSIPKKFRPLAGRLNVVLTRQPESQFRAVNEIPDSDSVIIVDSFQSALHCLGALNKVDKIFVAGGGQIYAEAIKRPECRNIYYTEISDPEFMCDVHFPQIPIGFQRSELSEVKKDGNGITYQFLCYSR